MQYKKINTRKQYIIKIYSSMWTCVIIIGYPTNGSTTIIDQMSQSHALCTRSELLQDTIREIILKNI